MHNTIQKILCTTLLLSMGLLYVPSVFSVAGDVQLDVSTGGQIIGSALITNKFTDAANSAYYLDPAASTTSLTVAGNVGIGTTEPGTALSVNGIISGNTGNLRLQATGTGTGSTGTGSIYFLNSSGTTKGRLDTGVSTATGGTITYSGGYTYHTFTGSGTFTPPSGGSIEYLVVAGGGGGGRDNYSTGTRGSGGGGAGGLKYGTGHAVTATPYTVTVGAGGAGGSVDAEVGVVGSNSVLDTITANGGGGGGGNNAGGTALAPTAGGSGGGGGHGHTGAAGNAGEGFAGGNGYAGASYDGGGGGGAGAVGANGVDGAAGNGGAGLNTYSAWATATSTGVSGYYAGGGGGKAAGGTEGSGGAGGAGLVWKELVQLAQLTRVVVVVVAVLLMVVLAAQVSSLLDISPRVHLLDMVLSTLAPPIPHPLTWRNIM